MPFAKTPLGSILASDSIRAAFWDHGRSELASALRIESWKSREVITPGAEFWSFYWTRFMPLWSTASVSSSDSRRGLPDFQLGRPAYQGSEVNPTFFPRTVMGCPVRRWVGKYFETFFAVSKKAELVWVGLDFYGRCLPLGSRRNAGDGRGSE